jgi:hypothetical protein
MGDDLMGTYMHTSIVMCTYIYQMNVYHFFESYVVLLSQWLLLSYLQI